MKVLVPQLINPNGNPLWAENAEKIFNTLTFENKVRAVFDGATSPEGGKFARHARARNAVLEQSLDDSFTHVFWMDSDVVEYPPDIIEQLAAISSKDVVAPYVFIEDNDWWLFKRFYDISCFLDKENQNFHWSPPLYNRASGDVTTEVNSVGTCFLIPAEIHRKFKYDPFDNRNEHVSFFETARKNGYKVLATPEVQLRHAFLPKYGESFH